MAIHIETAQPHEKAMIVTLLEQSDLPTEDLPKGLLNFVIAKDGEIPVGVAGLESFGTVGLLRSIAIDRTYQGNGIAAQLIDRLLFTADALKLAELYLITNTADRYFTRYGFSPVSRETVPESIQQTQQFSSLCPSSATVMKRTLSNIIL